MILSAWLLFFYVWIISAILELLAATSPRSVAKPLAIIAIFVSAIASGMLLGFGVNLLAVVFLILAAYRMVQLGRILAGRLSHEHLKRVSLRASTVILAAQLATAVLDRFWPENISSSLWLIALAASQLVVAAVFLVSFIREYKKSKWQSAKLSLSDRQLPTLTVAIPAKNETSELEKCLNSLLASDYPKLEILVLDDAAGNKTGEIINALAHDGARFILGEAPSDNWLAKNLAYERLAAEANGEIVLFCGVDARFNPASLRLLVQKMTEDKLDMISLMPANIIQPRSLLTQPMRYFWELARLRFGTSAPVLSTCWLIKKTKLQSLGGFDAVRREIIPERYFAAACAAENCYSFLRSDHNLGVTSEKPAWRQRNTVVRTRYPLLHRRLASVAGTSLFTLAYLAGPLVLVILLPLYGWSITGELMAALSVIIWLAIYGVILKESFGVGYLFAPEFFAAILLDLWLVNFSLLKYEFGRVLWKGRDVAMPVVGKAPN